MPPLPPRGRTPAQLPADAAAELRHLRLQVMAMNRYMAVIQRRPVLRYGWLKPLVKDLETNPRTQYKVHLYGVIYWLINFPLVALLFFFAPGLWLKLGIFITLIYSIYANFATDYGAMSAAMAAFGQDPLPEIPAEPHLPGPEETGG